MIQLSFHDAQLAYVSVCEGIRRLIRAYLDLQKRSSVGKNSFFARVALRNAKELGQTARRMRAAWKAEIHRLQYHEVRETPAVTVRIRPECEKKA